MPAGPPEQEVVIEHPAAGETYCYDDYGVYGYDTYPPGTVLAGQTRRRSLGRYDSLDEAKKEWPHASVADGSGFFRAARVPAEPPDWFDPAAAGETWAEEPGVGIDL
jgi:hypothetical protein